MIVLCLIPLWNTHEVKSTMLTKQKLRTIKPLRKDQEKEFELEPIVVDAPIPRFSFTQQEKELLAMTIYGEASDEPYEGAVAVGVVILNRLEYGGYGESLHDVVYAGNGSQFNCIRRKDWGYFRDVDMRAAEEALINYNYPKNMLYFCNIKLSGDTKFVRNIILKNKYIKIGHHTFALRK